MSTTQKLTKKQKKSLAFRERKTGKGQEKNELDDMEANAVPVMEDQDNAGDDSYTPQVAGDGGKEKGKASNDTVRDEGKCKQGEVSGKGKGKAEAEDVSIPVEKVNASRKRKRDGEDELGHEDEETTGDQLGKKTSKRKKITEEKQTSTKEGKQQKQRYILFLGNLKYTTTLDAIKAHFAVCGKPMSTFHFRNKTNALTLDPPPTIRLLTPKSNGQTGPAKKAKSKGCAFLEFSHRNALQQGLKLHQSTLDGRMINVELTAGGGGKGESRLAKVRERNKALLEQREERVEKEAKQDNSFHSLPRRPQRYSATSGIVQKPSAKRTWTVGDVAEDKTHRGGERHRKKSKGASRTWGTGVNAIPVG